MERGYLRLLDGTIIRAQPAVRLIRTLWDTAYLWDKFTRKTPRLPAPTIPGSLNAFVSSGYIYCAWQIPLRRLVQSSFVVQCYACWVEHRKQEISKAPGSSLPDFKEHNKRLPFLTRFSSYFRGIRFTRKIPRLPAPTIPGSLNAFVSSGYIYCAWQIPLRRLVQSSFVVQCYACWVEHRKQEISKAPGSSLPDFKEHNKRLPFLPRFSSYFRGIRFTLESFPLFLHGYKHRNE